MSPGDSVRAFGARAAGRRAVLAFAGTTVVFAAVAVAISSAVGASSTARWPAGEIRVVDRSGWQEAVELAATQWNAAQLGVRFVLVQTRGDVVVTRSPDRVDDYCDGRCDAFVTRIGYGGGRPTELIVAGPPPPDEPTLTDVQLIVHELGHVLGLRHHAHDCKVMNRQLAQRCEPLRKNDAWLCGPLDRDLQRAGVLYVVRPARIDPYCAGG